MAPPASAKVVDLGELSPGKGGNEPASETTVTGLAAVQAAADFPFSAPDTLVGLPRQDVRLIGNADSQTVVVTYGQGLGGIVVAQRKAPAGAAAARPGPLGSLPAVSLDGVTAHELATQLGTIVTWQNGGVSTTPRGIDPSCRRRGRGTGASMSDERPVVARGLSKTYGEVVAVDNVDLTVEAGDVFGYLGPNGAGKTTSLRMLLGLIRPTVRLGAALRARPTRRRRARPRRGRRLRRRSRGSTPT